MARFVRRGREIHEEELLLRSPREEFERFVAARVRALEKLGETAEARQVLQALELGRAHLSAALGGRAGDAEAPAAD